MAQLRLRADELAWREIDGEIVAVDVDTSTYLSGNPAAALLWGMLATGTTRDELVDRLVEHFDIERERAERDVDAFVSTLAARNLLEE